METFFARVSAFFMALIELLTMYVSAITNPDARDKLKPYLFGGRLSIAAVEYQDDAVYFTADGVHCALEFSPPHGWRLRTAQKDGAFDDLGAGQLLSYYLGEDIPNRTEPLEKADNNTFIASDGSRAQLKNGKGIVFYTPSGKQAYNIDIVYTDKSGVLHVAGDLDKNERLYGTGERFNQINQRGKKVSIYSVDRWSATEGNSYAPIPVVTSSRGCGLFMNRNNHMVIDLGATSKNRYDFQLTNGPADLYVYATERITDVLYGYSVVTGFAPEVADWAFGTQICRYAPEFSTPQGVYDMAANMEANGFPWDAVIIEGFDAENKNNWAALREIADFVHGKGKKLMIYEASGSIPWQFGPKNEYLLHDSKGNTALPDSDHYDNINYNRGRTYIDITLPSARDWWLHDAWGQIIETFNVNGAKIDFCEKLPEYNITLKFSDGRATAGAHHWLPVVCNTLMFNLFDSLNEDGAMAFARGGGIGAQRYPFLWAGDQKRDFEFLQAALKAVLSAGLSGIPYMSFDMAGYSPTTRPLLNPEAEVFSRGVEFACFTANIETHGTVTRAYDFDDATKNIYRIYANMHDVMRPYLVEFGKVASATATPLVRALVLFDQDDDKCADIWDEYMLGDAFLVAPIMELNRNARSVYLPEGSWTDLYSGKVYEGGQTITGYKASLSKIPVFVNNNSQSETLRETLEAMRPYINEVNALNK